MAQAFQSIVIQIDVGLNDLGVLQRIRITRGRVYLNGQLVQEPYVPEQYQDSLSAAELTVPADSYFVMGDHRTMSRDSREFGPVARDLIYGKAVFGYWPVERVGVLH